jgi:hypothetical protein
LKQRPKSGKKASSSSGGDRLPVWQRTPPPQRVAIPPAIIAQALQPGERPPFTTSFSVAEGPLSQRGRAPSGIREKGAGNHVSGATVAAVGTPSPVTAATVAAAGGVHGRRASHLPQGATATNIALSSTSPAKRPLIRAASVSSPAGVPFAMTTSPQPLTTSSSVKRMSLSSPSNKNTASASPGTRIPLPKGASLPPTAIPTVCFALITLVSLIIMIIELI